MLSEVDCGGLKCTEVVYLMQEEGQELSELVGGQSLHIGLSETAQVLVFGLQGHK